MKRVQKIGTVYRSHAKLLWIAIGSFAALAISGTLALLERWPWLSDALMNAGFLGIGLGAAFLIGERLIDEAEELRWSGVEQAINRRAMRCALTALSGFTNSPTIRSHISLESGEAVPAYGDLVNNPSRALEFCAQTLVPAIKTFTCLRPPPRTTTDFTGFTQEDWRILAEGTHRAVFHASQTIILFGRRPTPELQAAVIDLDTYLSHCGDLFSQWDVERSGAGVMAFQVALLENLDNVADASVRVLRELV